MAIEEVEDGIRATVRSSDGSRTYRVIVKEERDGVLRVYSDDNGTRLRGYVGYPIIAVLMLAGRLPRDPRVEEALRGTPWRRLNESLRKYSLVMERVLSEAEARGLDRRRAYALIRRVLDGLRRLQIIYDESLLNSE